MPLQPIAQLDQELIRITNIGDVAQQIADIAVHVVILTARQIETAASVHDE